MKYVILIIVSLILGMYLEYSFPSQPTNCVDYTGLQPEDGQPIPLRNDTQK